MKLIRVIYGKKNTPKNMREYQIEGFGTAGTLKEYKKHFPDEKFEIVDELNKLSKQQEAEIYCIKNGHANYILKCFEYIHCGRCGNQIGDQLGGRIVIGCDEKDCKVCPPLIKNLSPLDKQIFKLVEAANKKGIADYDKILKDIDFEEVKE